MSNFELRELFDDQLQKIASLIRENNSVVDVYNKIASSQISELNIIESSLFNALTTDSSEAPYVLMRLRDISGLSLKGATEVFAEYNHKLTQFEDKLEKLGGIDKLALALEKSQGELKDTDKEQSRVQAMYIADRDAFFKAKQIHALASKEEIKAAVGSTWFGRLISTQKRELHSKLIELDTLKEDESKAHSFRDDDSYLQMIDAAKNTEWVLDNVKTRSNTLQETIRDLDEKIQRHNRLTKEIFSFKPVKFAQKVFQAAIIEIDNAYAWQALYAFVNQQEQLDKVINLKAKISATSGIIDGLCDNKHALRTMFDDLERNEKRLRNSIVSHKSIVSSDLENEIKRVLSKMSKSIEWARQSQVAIMELNVDSNSTMPNEQFKINLLNNHDVDSAGGLSLLGKGLIDNNKLPGEFKAEVVAIFSRNGIYKEEDIRSPYLNTLQNFEIPSIAQSDSVNTSGHQSQSIHSSNSSASVDLNISHDTSASSTSPSYAAECAVGD